MSFGVVGIEMRLSRAADDGKESSMKMAHWLAQRPVDAVFGLYLLLQHEIEVERRC